MKAPSPFRVTAICVVLLTLQQAVSRTSGSVQVAWVARYSSGLVGATNRVLKMAQDNAGSLVVAGSGTGAAKDYDYLTLKFAQDGRLLWAQRYASLSNHDDQVRGLAVDSADNVLVTGTSVTAKYSAEGVLLWTAPFAGRDVVVAGDGSSYVTGYSEGDFTTVKLTAEGSNAWVRSTDLANSGWWDRSDKVAVDEAGNVYVAGGTSWSCFNPGGGAQVCYTKLGVLKYDSTGKTLWKTELPPGVSINYFETIAMVVARGHTFLCARGDTAGTFYTARLAADGSPDWGQSFVQSLTEGATALCVGRNDTVHVTGRLMRHVNGIPNVSYCTFSADPAGSPTWQSLYSNGGSYGGRHVANALALDDNGNVYVTGRSDSPVSDADWATIKYSPDGAEQWVRRYDGPAHDMDEGRAIAVDASGAVYVAGTQTTTNGSIETVLIKYIDLTNIELLPNGSAILRFIGTAGAPCRLQGSANLSDWSDVLNGVVGEDGIARFEDTNAPASQVRFYRMFSP